MRRVVIFLVLLLALLYQVSQSREDFIYVRDDATGDTAVGAGAVDLIWLNQFDALTWANRITSISVAFGWPGFGPPDGTPVTLALWDDPNNDGDPADAVLLTTANGTIANAGTDIYNVFTIPTTELHGSFFAGVLVTEADNEYPARMDDSITGWSWVAFNDVGQGNLLDLSANLDSVRLIDDYGIPGTWMIRANAILPEPSTLILLSLGAAGLFACVRRRRRRAA